MNSSNRISRPTETVRLPAPSWAPAVFALGVLGLVAGTFATGFMFPTWYYTVAGAALAIGGLASMIRRGRRAFYSLPREGAGEPASLPVDSFGPPSRD